MRVLRIVVLVLLALGGGAWYFAHRAGLREADAKADDALARLPGVASTYRTKRAVLEQAHAALLRRVVLPDQTRPLAAGALEGRVLLIQHRTTPAPPEAKTVRWVFSLEIDEWKRVRQPSSWPIPYRKRLPRADEIRGRIHAELSREFTLHRERFDVVARAPAQRPPLERVLLPREASATLRPVFFAVGDAPDPGQLAWAVALTSHTTSRYGKYENGEEAREALLTAHFYASPGGAYLGTRTARGIPPWLHAGRTIQGDWVHPDVKGIAHGQLVEWLCTEHGYAPPERYERLFLEAVPESVASR